MQYGAAYPTTEVAGDPDAIITFIRALEDLGFSHILAYDHIVKTSHEGREPKLNGPYTEHDSFDDPFVFFGFAAGLTQKLGFATGVLCLPQRQTALVAQQAANVDLYARGRLRLGVGIGWNYVEFAALGMNFKTRARRIEEQIGLLRQLWSTPIVSFAGEFDQIDRGGINPRPNRPIPIWLGGYTEPAYVRAAKLADGFIFAAPGPVAVEALARLRQLLTQAGRDPANFGSELLAIFAANAEQSADHLRQFRDAGGQMGTVHTCGQGFGANIHAHIDYLAKVKHLLDAG